MQRIDPQQLAQAFGDSTFFFEYQPIVDLRTGEVRHVEALVRWDHPALGVLQPGSFLSLIHGAQLSDALTAWSFKQAIGDLPRLRELYGASVAASINLSQRQLVDPDATVALVASTIESFDEDPASICVEVVEDLSQTDIRRSANAIADLRGIGVRVFLDDFGTGASTLSALTDMDYDGLKIDRSFVRGIGSNTRARSIVDSIVAFGARIDISVVAEGVESGLELESLQDINCWLGQGFFLGRPRRLAAGPERDQPALIDLRSRASERSGAAELAAISLELDQINLSSTSESFAERSEKLEQLDQRAAALGVTGEIIRCEIGLRTTRAAIYAGESETVVRHGTKASLRAEQVGQWGYSAEILTMVAAETGALSETEGVRIESLMRALEIRMTKDVGSDRSDAIDNGIGIVFANLGLWQHAYRWWKDSLDRQAGPAGHGAMMCGLNLIDLELQRVEGLIDLSDGTPRELSLALTEQILDRLTVIPQASSGAVAAFRSRLALAQKDTTEASAALETVGDASADIVSHSLVLRSRAMLAQACEDWDGFLEHASALVTVLDGHTTLTHQDDLAQRLRVTALTAVGRHEEAASILELLLARRRRQDGANLQTLFGWIRVHVDLSLRFAELEALRLNTGG